MTKDSESTNKNSITNILAALSAGGILVAIITLIGVKYQADRSAEAQLTAVNLPIAATLTAEAKLTMLAVQNKLSPTIIVLPQSTTPPTPSSTASPTLTATRLPTNTPTRTSTPTPIPCPFQGKDDFTTLVTLINAEAEAVNKADPASDNRQSIDFINLIFAPTAVIRDRQNDPQVNPPAPTPRPQIIWSSPTARYPGDLFKNTKFLNATHTDPMTVGQGITATQAWLVSGSSGEYLDGNTWKQYYNPSKLKSAYGSDHWIFGKNNVGCWVIVQYDFDASHIPFPP